MCITSGTLLSLVFCVFVSSVYLQLSRCFLSLCMCMYIVCVLWCERVLGAVKDRRSSRECSCTAGMQGNLAFQH